MPLKINAINLQNDFQQDLHGITMEDLCDNLCLLPYEWKGQAK